jgi:hypothetical protein
VASTGRLRRVTPVLTIIMLLSLVLALPTDAEPPRGSAADVVERVTDVPDEVFGVEIEVEDPSSLSRLAEIGIDLAHWHEGTDDGHVHSVAFVTSEEIDLLESMGVEILQVDALPGPEAAASQLMGNVDGLEVRERINEGRGRGAASAGKAPVVDEQGSLRVLRADTFTNYAGDFLSVEVRSANGPTDTITVAWEIDGTTYERNLSTFNDAGQYIYHRTPRAWLVDGTPEKLTITSADGTEMIVATEPWAEYDGIGYPEGFQWGFLTTGYPDAVDSMERIEALAAEFPDLAEIIELPYETHGYRRPAMLLYGGFTSTVVNVESVAYGHEGGNDLTFEIVNDGTADRELEVTRAGDDITVFTSTDATGAPTATAAQVIEAINSSPATGGVVHAFTYRGNAGNGIAETNRGRQTLSDFLNAPEDKISRDPQTVKAIRIGAERDGSKTGVFVYSQEHAREWVTPVVALESAERLLRNYGSDPDTTRFVDELDIFIIPTVNPDGTNYSLYDARTQRRNMNNYCDETNRDAGRRNNWGVDLNRNFRVGTLWDGYSGASTSCVSDVFLGPEPASENEIKNELWLIDEFDHIRFSMNVHTFGGYFMWAPGAYQMPGRIPLERPSVGVEEYFFDASQTILGRIAEHRGTVVEPGRTGPIIDVLYSAAGNSADDVWYNSLERGEPIYAWNFEAGADRYTGGGSSGWQTPGQFWPDFAAEGFDQAMEFANGVYGLLEVAAEFQADDTAPTSSVNVTNGGWYTGAVDVEFTTDEPATIYYTTDGSRPTFDSPVVERRDARDSAAPVHVEASTTLRWFAVDAAGNIEGGYEPEGQGHDYRRVQIRIR